MRVSTLALANIGTCAWLALASCSSGADPEAGPDGAGGSGAECEPCAGLDAAACADEPDCGAVTDRTGRDRPLEYAGCRWLARPNGAGGCGQGFTYASNPVTRACFEFGSTCIPDTFEGRSRCAGFEDP